jgi:hypothetical protein
MAVALSSAARKVATAIIMNKATKIAQSAAKKPFEWLEINMRLNESSVVISITNDKNADTVLLTM